jgi:phosphate transport system substrate-binding protein
MSRSRALAAAAVALLGGASCARPGSSLARDEGGLQASSANVTLKGSDTMVILGQRWAESFMKANPGTTVQVTGGGSGTGIAALINASTDICASSRPMKAKERAELLERRGAAVVETKVALDAVAVYVNASSSVEEISLAALRKVYRGETRSWSALGGPERPIVLYGRENNSGTYGYFKEHVLAGEDFAASTQTLAGTSAVANAVKGDRNGIGYGGVAYLSGVRALRVKRDDASPAVAPSLATAEDGSYPVSRFLYFYTAGAPAGAAGRFVAWVEGPEGQKVIGDVGFYPLPRAAE